MRHIQFPSSNSEIFTIIKATQLRFVKRLVIIINCYQRLRMNNNEEEFIEFTVCSHVKQTVTYSHKKLSVHCSQFSF